MTEPAAAPVPPTSPASSPPTAMASPAPPAAPATIRARGVVPPRARTTQAILASFAIAYAAAVVVLDLAAPLGVEGATSPLHELAGHVSGSLTIGRLGVVAIVVALLAPFVIRRARPSRLEVRAKPGRVRVRRPWSLGGRTLRAPQVTGASTARLASGRVSLIIQTRGAARPLTLELDSEDDAKRIGRALGVGHHGAGYLEVALGGARIDVPFDVARLALAPFAVLAWSMGRHFVLGYALMGAISVLSFTFAALVRAALGPADHARLALSPTGVSFAGKRQPYRRVAYSQVPGAMLDARGVTLALGGGPRLEHFFLPVTRGLFGSRAATPFELEHVMAQLEAARARARGEGEAAPDHAASLDVLRKRPGEVAAAFVARLDALAAQLGRGGTYRGNSLTAGELWAAVDDPDCDPEVRAGAARVLAKLGAGDAPARIDAHTLAARDAATKKRLRAALAPSPEEAAALLEAAAVDEVEAMTQAAILEARARVG